MAINLSSDPNADKNAEPRTREQPRTLRCVDCRQVMTADERDEFDNVLRIEFSGGYGWFIDPLPIDPDSDEYVVYLCHDCAHALCETVPWIYDLLSPLNSHAHRQGTVSPDHKGWDLPHKKR